jgi:hypothetical protein
MGWFKRTTCRTIYHNPVDFLCPMCNHKVAEHRNASLANDQGCIIRGCQCAMRQRKLWKMAQEWRYEPPTENVLLEFINNEKEVK